MFDATDSVSGSSVRHLLPTSSLHEHLAHRSTSLSMLEQNDGNRLVSPIF